MSSVSVWALDVWEAVRRRESERGVSVQLSGVACERPDSLVPGMRGAKHVGDFRAEHRHLLLHEGEALREEVHLALCATVLAAGDREALGRADGALLAAPVVGSVVVLLRQLALLLLLLLDTLLLLCLRAHLILERERLLWHRNLVALGVLINVDLVIVLERPGV